MMDLYVRVMAALFPHGTSVQIKGTPTPMPGETVQPLPPGVFSDGLSQKLRKKLNMTESSSVRFLCCMSFWARDAAVTGNPPISRLY